MKRWKFLCVVALFGSLLIPGSQATAQDEDSRPIAGIDLGIAIPTTDKTWARLKLGATASPYFGYMFDNSFGIQANIHGLVFTPDDDDIDDRFPDAFEGYSREEDLSWLLGITVGPRLSLPFTDWMEFYLTGQGGVFGGLSGRVKDEFDGGVSLGGGFDFYLTEQLALSLWGRWNYVFIQPDPPIAVQNIRSERINENLQYVTAGIGLKFDFRAPEEAPPPPPPVVSKAPPTPAPLPPPTRRKVVLRGVRFDRWQVCG